MLEIPQIKEKKEKKYNPLEKRSKKVSKDKNNILFLS